MLGLGVGWKWWVVVVDVAVVVLRVIRDVFALRRISLNGMEEGVGWMLKVPLR